MLWLILTFFLFFLIMFFQLVAIYLDAHLRCAIGAKNIIVGIIFKNFSFMVLKFDMCSLFIGPTKY
jgi:hypothetical protein